MDADKQAFNKCYFILCNSLNVEVIMPKLVEENLLTEHDEKELTNLDANFEKVEYLTKVLPKKGTPWLDKFLKCLGETLDGTGHCKVVKELESVRNEDTRSGDLEEVEETSNGEELRNGEEEPRNG